MTHLEGKFHRVARFSPATALRWRVAVAAMAAMAGSTQGIAQVGLPGGPRLANGTAVITRTSNSLNIVNSPGAILNWDSFSIAAGNTVRFAQQGHASVVLNRVTGGGGSEIFGTLTSNGRVFLINPHGILFGRGARVDVQGLLASTLDIRDDDFLQGRYSFACSATVSCSFGAPDVLDPTLHKVVVRNGAEITTRTAGNGGQVWLLARGAIETEKGSRIDAPLGQVAMAAAREVVVTSPSLGAITFTLNGSLGSRIDLAGDIDVERGAAGFFADTIRLAGPVRARSANDGVGQIQAAAGTEIKVDDDARLDVSGSADADGGLVKLRATQNILVSAAAEIAADGGAPAIRAGGTGGLIDFNANQIVLPVVGPLAQVHAYGLGAPGSDFSRFGRVRYQETGSFNYAVAQGSAFSGSSATETRRTRTNGAVSDFSSLLGDSRTITQVAAGNRGEFLVVVQSGHTDSSTVNGITTATNARGHQWTVVDSNGLAVATQTLPMGTTGFVPGVSLAALTRGGWAIAVGGEGLATRVQVVSADGRTAPSVAIDGSLVSMTPMLWGGFTVTAFAAGSLNTLFFDAVGVRITDLADARLLDRGTPAIRNARDLPFDARGQAYLSAPGSPGNGALVVEDAVSHAIESRATYALTGAQGTTPASLTPAGPRAVPIVRTVRRTSPACSTLNCSNTDRAVVEMADLQSGQVATLLDFQGSDSLVAQGDSAVQRIHIERQTGPRVVAGGDASVGVVHQVIDSVTTSTSTQTDSLNSSFTQSASVDTVERLSIAKRSAVQTPFANPSPTGGYLGLPDAATRPGQLNGFIDVALTGVPDQAAGGTGRAVAVRPAPAEQPNRQGGSGTPTLNRPAPRLEGPGLAEADLGCDTPAQCRDDEIRRGLEIVRDTFGRKAADKYVDGDFDVKKKLIDEVAMAQMTGEDFYPVIQAMSEGMRTNFFNAMSDLDALGVAEDKELRKGLQDALFSKGTGIDPDTGERVRLSRTPLEFILATLDTELKAANSPQAKHRIRALVTRELVIAAREQAGQKVDDDAPIEVVSAASGERVRIDRDGNVLRGP